VGTAAAATDSRTVKALLLNGSNKPAGWIHTATTPLDTRYGAGILDVNRSDLELLGGKQTFTLATTGTAPIVSGALHSDEGWDFNLVSTATPVNHYLFDFTGQPSAQYSLTATLTWNRHANQTAINNLDFLLFNAAGA